MPVAEWWGERKRDIKGGERERQREAGEEEREAGKGHMLAQK